MNQQNSDVAFIFKRSFVGAFWGVIFIPLFVAYFIFKFTPTSVLMAHGVGVENPYIMGGILFYCIIAAIYGFIIGHTKSVDRIIRLMSDKDGGKMTPSQSLLLSRKIFKDSAKFRWALFLKYYTMISIIFIVILLFLVFTVFRAAVSDMSLSQGFITLFILAALVLIAWIYMHYFLGAKTRFVWFVYLSHFGENKVPQDIFNDVHELDKADSKDEKAAMIGYLKREMAADGSAVLGAQGVARGMALDYMNYSKASLNFKQYKDAYNKLHSKNPELSPKLLQLL